MNAPQSEKSVENTSAAIQYPTARSASLEADDDTTFPIPPAKGAPEGEAAPPAQDGEEDKPFCWVSF